MIPRLFGDPRARLYGVHHAPEDLAAAGAGVVLCPPILQEYPRTHRALCVLADRIAEAGMHALRFDWSATGDSAGDAAEARVERWKSDVGVALDELRESTGCERMGVVGLGLGATLGAQAAAERDDVSALGLWAPVVRGDDYLSAARSLHRAWLASESENQPGILRRSRPGELLGAPLPPELEAGLRAIDLAALGRCPAQRVRIVEGLGAEDPGPVAVSLRELGARVEVDALPDRAQAAAPPAVGERVHVPRPIVTTLVDWIAECLG